MDDHVNTCNFNSTICCFEVSYYNENLEQRRTRRYEDIELYQITENLERDESLKDVAKHFIITNKAEPYILQCWQQSHLHMI